MRGKTSRRGRGRGSCFVVVGACVSVGEEWVNKLDGERWLVPSCRVAVAAAEVRSPVADAL